MAKVFDSKKGAQLASKKGQSRGAQTRAETAPSGNSTRRFESWPLAEFRVRREQLDRGLQEAPCVGESCNCALVGVSHREERIEILSDRLVLAAR